MFSKATRFEILLEAVPDALVGVDQKGVIRFVNRQTEALFGIDRDDVIGRPVETMVPEPLWQIYTEHRQGYFSDPRTRSSGLDLELNGLHRDGTEFPINVSMSHIDTGDVLLVITALRDVARRRRAVKNAELITAIVQHSDDAIIGGTLRGTITSWNPAAERMYGYTTKEILGRSVTLLAPADRAGELFATLDGLKDRPHPERLETIGVRKDGSVVPVSLTVAPIRDEDGAVVGFSAVHRDVTEQRSAFEVAQRMKAIVESSDDAIFGGTIERIIVSWNSAAERMYGYTSQEIIGQPIYALIPEDRAAEIRDVVARIAAGEHVERLETVGVRKDGTMFPVSATISPIRNEKGDVVGASSVHRDVTAQRQAFEVAERMKAIIESSNEAIIGETLDGIITTWNPAAQTMYGYTSEEIIGQPINDLIPEGRKAETSRIVAKIKAGERVARLETVRIRKDGTVIPVSATISPIHGSDGTIVGASEVHRDETAEERATH